MNQPFTITWQFKNEQLAHADTCWDWLTACSYSLYSSQEDRGLTFCQLPNKGRKIKEREFLTDQLKSYNRLMLLQLDLLKEIIRFGSGRFKGESTSFKCSFVIMRVTLNGMWSSTWSILKAIWYFCRREGCN